MKNPSTFERQFFTDLAKEHGNSPKTLNYGSEESKTIRSIKARMIIDNLVSPKRRDITVLDIGCGFCDLYHQLSYCSSIDVILDRYIGVDISQSVLDIVSEDIKDADNVALVCQDFFVDCISNEVFDIVACIGALNYDHDWDSVKAKIAMMVEYSDIATVFTLSSSHTPKEHRPKEGNTVEYWDPVLVFDELSDKYPLIALHHDYLDREFIVSIVK